jgi:hypothetical protein
MGHSNQGITRPSHVPIHDTATEHGRELECARAELGRHRRGAQDNMQIVADTLDEVLVEIVVGGWVGDGGGELLLHDRKQLRADLTNLIALEQASDLTSGKHIVDGIEEGFVVDLVVGRS